MTFDPATARIIEESSSYTYDTPLQPHSNRALSDVTTVVENRIVTSVPPDVIRDARQLTIAELAGPANTCHSSWRGHRPRQATRGRAAESPRRQGAGDRAARHEDC